MRGQRRLLAALPGLAFALTACAGTALRSAEPGPPASPRSSAAPSARVLVPAAAPPAQVAAAFIKALNAHDLSQARPLMSDQHAASVAAEQDSWFRNVISIGNVKIGPLVWENGGPGSLAQGYRQVVEVPVQFTLTQKHPDSIPNGRVFWGYLMARNSDDQRWLIVDEGPV